MKTVNWMRVPATSSSSTESQLWRHQMTDPKKEPNDVVVPKNTGGVMDIVAGKITSAEAFGSFKEIVTVVQDLVELHEKQSTKREQLVTYRETQIARLQLVEH